MQRTTIMLPNDLRARAQCRTVELGMSLGQFIQQSLATRLSGSENRVQDPLYADNAVFEGEFPSSLFL
jgi:hypothetical protein